MGGHPFGDLWNGTYTDHFSHMNSARLFMRVGSEIWQRPIREMLPALDQATRQSLPEDLRTPKPDFYQVPGWRADKPVVVSWSQNPRNYPPGNFLLVAPIAAAYHFTELPAYAANRLLIALFLILAHVAFFLAFRELLSSRRHDLVALLSVAGLYGHGLFWTMQGFYDLAAAVPLFFCARFLARGRGVEAVFCFSAAFFLHFRALFLSPWALYGGWLALRDPGLRAREVRPWLLVLASGILGLSALYPFLLLQSAFARLEANTPLHADSPCFSPAIAVAFGALLVSCGVVLARAKAWLDLAILGVMSVLIMALRQAYEWHPLILYSWLAGPVPAVIEQRRMIRWVRLAFLAGATVLIFWNHRY